MSEEEEPEEERPRSRLAGYAALAVAGAAYEASRRRKLEPKLGENEVTPERTSIGVRFAPPAGTFVSSGSLFQLTYRASFAPTGLWGAVDMYYDDGGRQTFTLTKPASFTTNRTSVNVPFQGKVSSAGTVVSATIGGETTGIRRGEFYGILLAITPELPEGKILIPGVVGHYSAFIEHPELVADRLVQYAGVVGRQNVIAGTDCGLGTRVGHGKIAWSKREALAEGAAIASRRLWK